MTALLPSVDSLPNHELFRLPLQENRMSVDLTNQHKAMIEFSGRLQSLASQFADLYSKISLLENEIAAQNLNDDFFTAS